MGKSSEVDFLQAYSGNALETSPESDASAITVQIAQAPDVALGVPDVELLGDAATGAVPRRWTLVVTRICHPGTV